MDDTKLIVKAIFKTLFENNEELSGTKNYKQIITSIMVPNYNILSSFEVENGFTTR